MGEFGTHNRGNRSSLVSPVRSSVTVWGSMFRTRAPRMVSPMNSISPFTTAAGLSSRKIMLCSFRSASGDDGGGAAAFVCDSVAVAVVGGIEAGVLGDAACATVSGWGYAITFVRITMLVLTLIGCWRAPGLARGLDPMAGAALASSAMPATRDVRLLLRQPCQKNQ